MNNLVQLMSIKHINRPLPCMRRRNSLHWIRVFKQPLNFQTEIGRWVGPKSCVELVLSSLLAYGAPCRSSESDPTHSLLASGNASQLHCKTLVWDSIPLLNAAQNTQRTPQFITSPYRCNNWTMHIMNRFYACTLQSNDRWCSGMFHLSSWV